MRKLTLCLSLVLIASCSAKNATPIVYYNDHWQKNQDSKLVFCYQRAPTMEEVVDCLLTLDVFI